MNKFATLENHLDMRPDIKVEPNPLGQFKDLLEPSSLGQINELSPAQTVAGKDTLNPLKQCQKALDLLKAQVKKIKMFDQRNDSR